MFVSQDNIVTIAPLIAIPNTWLFYIFPSDPESFLPFSRTFSIYNLHINAENKMLRAFIQIRAPTQLKVGKGENWNRCDIKMRISAKKTLMACNRRLLLKITDHVVEYAGAYWHARPNDRLYSHGYHQPRTSISMGQKLKMCGSDYVMNPYWKYVHSIEFQMG